jgi:hypothetical protein
MSRPQSGAEGLKKRKIKESTRDAAKGAALKQALGRSFALKKGCGGSSAKGKATRILATSFSDISLCIKRSFAERRYSPSTGIDRSKWEIILEQHLIMGLIVKKEVVSENDD